MPHISNFENLAKYQGIPRKIQTALHSRHQAGTRFGILGIFIKKTKPECT